METETLLQCRRLADEHFTDALPRVTNLGLETYGSEG
jgi:hypothetical protein